MKWGNPSSEEFVCFVVVVKAGKVATKMLPLTLAMNWYSSSSFFFYFNKSQSIFVFHHFSQLGFSLKLVLFNLFLCFLSLPLNVTPLFCFYFLFFFFVRNHFTFIFFLFILFQLIVLKWLFLFLPYSSPSPTSFLVYSDSSVFCHNLSIKNLL